MANDEVVVKAITMYLTNPEMDVGDIARKFGVKRGAVYVWLKKAKIKVRRRPGGKVSNWKDVAQRIRENVNAQKEQENAVNNA